MTYEQAVQMAIVRLIERSKVPHIEITGQVMVGDDEDLRLDHYRGVVLLVRENCKKYLHSLRRKDRNGIEETMGMLADLMFVLEIGEIAEQERQEGVSN